MIACLPVSDTVAARLYPETGRCRALPCYKIPGHFFIERRRAEPQVAISPFPMISQHTRRLQRRQIPQKPHIVQGLPGGFHYYLPAITRNRQPSAHLPLPLTPL